MENKNLEPLVELFEECYRDEELEQLCQQPLDVLDVVCCATPPKYTKLGLCGDLMSWTMKNHPLVSQARAITIGCTHPATVKVSKKMGFTTRKKTNIPGFINKKREKPFQDFAAVVEKKLGIKGFEEVHLCAYRYNIPKPLD